MLILFILIRSLRPRSHMPSLVQSVQNDPVPTMKAFLAGLAT